MTNQDKNDVVVRFLQGVTVTDLSAFYAVRRSDVEELLRHALFSLMKVREVEPIASSPAVIELTDAR